MASIAPPAPGRVARRLRVADWMLPLLGVAAVLALFELLSRSNVIDRHFFPPVSDMFRALWDQLGTHGLWRAVGDTLEGWALGLGIAAAVAIPVGMLLGSSRLAYRALRAVIEFLRPI